jgi:hypothetical protein
MLYLTPAPLLEERGKNVNGIIKVSYIFLSHRL